MTLMVLVATLLIASFTDLRDRTIPNWLVAAAAAAGLALAAGEGTVVRAAVAGLAVAAPFLAAALIRPEGMGMGDVKLAAVMGIYLGQAAWVAVAVGLGFAGACGVMISLGKRTPPGETALPLAPFLALGAAAVVLLRGHALQ